MNKQNKEKKGITLISLVLTIVVLLILVGITIPMITGDNQLLNRASDAKYSTKVKSEIQLLEVASNAARAKNKYSKIEEDKLSEELNYVLGENKTDVKTLAEGVFFRVTFLDTNNCYAVNNYDDEGVRYLGIKGKETMEAIIVASPKKSIIPKRDLSIDVNLYVLNTNDLVQVKYGWSTSKNEEPVSYFDLDLEDKLEENSVSVKASTINTMIPSDTQLMDGTDLQAGTYLPDGTYYLKIKAIINEEEQKETFGEYVIGQEEQNQDNEVQYKVIYNYARNGGYAQNGEQEEQIDYYEGKSIDLKKKGTKAGYTFIGWSKNPNGTKGLDRLLMGSSNVTLYALFKKNITVTFMNCDGFRPVALALYNNDTASMKIPIITPARDGFRFDSWNTQQDGSGDKYKNGDTLICSSDSNDITLYAQWKEAVGPIIAVNTCANNIIEDGLVTYLSGTENTGAGYGTPANSLVNITGSNLIANGTFETYTTIDAPSKTANGATHTWDKSLNGIPGNTNKAYNATNWGHGANMGIIVPEIGYHAHMRIVNNNAVFRFKTNEAYEGKTKANVTGGVTVGADGTVTAGRWLGISQIITGTNITAGKTYTVTMDVYRVSGSSYISSGLYFNTTSNSTTDFYAGKYNLKPLSTGQWENLSYTFTVPTNYNNANNPRLYIYGNEGAPGELYVDNVKLQESHYVWKDLSGNHNDGNAYGGPKWGKDNLTFDGVNDWVNLGQKNYEKNVTLEAEVNISEIQSGERQIMANYESGGMGLHLQDGKPAFQVYVKDKGWRNSLTNSTDVLELNKTYHLVGTYDGTKLRLYIDGELITEKSDESVQGTISPPTNNTVMALGTNPSGSSTANAGNFKGKIKMVRIYSKVLNEQEVKINYEYEKHLLERASTFTEHTQTVVTNGLQVQLNGIENAPLAHNHEAETWADLSGNNRKGTLRSGQKWSYNALNFNGTTDWVNLGQINNNYQTLEVTFSTNKIDNTKQHIIGNWKSGGGGININAGFIRGQYWINGSYQTIVSNVTPERGKIYSVSLTYDGTMVRLYINGVLKGTNEEIGTIKEPEENTVMALGTAINGKTSTGDLLQGKIYSARVYNRGLSSEEIVTNYEADAIFRKKPYVVIATAQDLGSGLTGYQLSDDENITSTSEGWTIFTATNEERDIKEVYETEDKLYLYAKDAVGNVSFWSKDSNAVNPVLNTLNTSSSPSLNNNLQMNKFNLDNNTTSLAPSYGSHLGEKLGITNE